MAKLTETEHYYASLARQMGRERDERFAQLKAAEAERDRYVKAWQVAEDHCKAAVARSERLRAAIEDYLLWEPGRAGHAEASRKLKAALDA